MQISQNDYLDQYAEQLLPITLLRRNAGSVLKKLETLGTLILTKDGRPIAKITPLEKSLTNVSKIDSDLQMVKKLAGGLHLGKTTPRQIKKIILKQYDRVLPRQ
ncbi:hypothetical protein HY946_03395 [Candidatus Gottesmanbacteria bacterium]|nr:hypothetical protein [Candidatus Gottesmanbacteria bacterium]